MFFESEQDALCAAEQLRRLGRRAQTLLAEIVQHQVVQRTTVGATLMALCEEGFVFVSDRSTPFQRLFEIRSALAGEEALGALHDGRFPK